jgi:hypothetical protein
VLASEEITELSGRDDEARGVEVVDVPVLAEATTGRGGGVIGVVGVTPGEGREGVAEEAGVAPEEEPPGKGKLPVGRIVPLASISLILAAIPASIAAFRAVSERDASRGSRAADGLLPFLAGVFLAGAFLAGPFLANGDLPLPLPDPA